MAISYVLFPQPIPIFYDTYGCPASGGYLITKDSITGLPKPTYSDPAGINANPTRIRLNVAGQPSTDGSSSTPLYCAIDDTPGSSLYQIEWYDSSGNLLGMIPVFPITSGTGGGGGPITINNNILNYFRNAQFQWWGVNTYADDDLMVGSTEVAEGWLYTREGNNATISIYKGFFNAGQTDVPFDPEGYLVYSAQTTGTDTENYISQRFSSVQTLNNEQITVSIYLRCLDLGSATQVSLYTIQNFGTGGSASITTLVSTFDVTDEWQLFSATFVVNDISGNSIGTNEDDYFEIAFQPLTNQIVDVGFANAEAQRGVGSGINFPYRTPNEEYVTVLPEILADSDPNTGTDIIGTGSITTPVAEDLNLTEYLMESFEGCPENILIGWNFPVNPNQFSRDVPNVADGQYVADQTIVLSDGNNVVSKSSFIGEPLILNVVQGGTKFGIFTIVENMYSEGLEGEYVSLSLEALCSVASTFKMAVLYWSGTPHSETKDCVAAWNASGADPSLSTNWNYASDVTEIDLDTDYSQFKVEGILLPDNISSLGVLVWNDDEILAPGNSVSVLNGTLTNTINAVRAKQENFSESLLRCQRYIYRTYPIYAPDIIGTDTGYTGIMNKPYSYGVAAALGTPLLLSYPIVREDDFALFISSNYIRHFFPTSMYDLKGPYQVTVYNSVTGAINSSEMRVVASGYNITYPFSNKIGISYNASLSNTEEATFYAQASELTSEFVSAPSSLDLVTSHFHIVVDATLGV